MSSNSSEMRKLLNNNDTTSLKVFSDHPEPATILGIAWDAHSDQFLFQVQLDDKEVHTKKSFLSEASKIFDPLGRLSPITIKIKILFQSLWLKKIGWDEQLPSETRSAWIDLRNSISRTPEIRIQRCITISDSLELHGFCDASKWAYAAVVYSRSQNSQGLFWIGYPAQIAPVSEIIPTNKRDRWRYVPCKQNPADFASRKLSAKEINNNEMWWIGPPWLRQNNDQWPDQPKVREVTMEIAMPIQVYDSTIKTEGANEGLLLDKIGFTFRSEYTVDLQIQKVLAYILRFIHNIRTRDRRYGTLLPSELDRATQYLAIHYQIRDFPEEYRCLRDNKPIPLKSKLRQLDPFIDAEGIMRVGGRLQKSLLPYSSRHPIILSHTAPIAIPITYDVHQKKQHPGINLLNSLVRQNFWIIRGKDVAKRIFQRCVKCLRQRPKMMNQLMGQLPEDRVNYTVPFGAIGIDFCGPFKIHPVRRRGSIPVKAYLCVLVCFATHAIHVEICMNLSTESFLGALKRFVSRRGLCHTIYCDNATNFVGARNYLKEVDEFLKTQGENIASRLLQDGIEWRFIPPASLHQRGLWESAVKSIKTQLTRTIGTEMLTLEEFSTLVAQIEGILNSRPLYSTDIDEPGFLTPAHFLIGRSIHQLPNSDHKIKLSPHARWDIVNHIYQHFWKRWQLEYLHTLQTRTKWQTQSKNLQLDDIVLIHDNSLQPTQWLMGRITKLHPGADGYVRVVDIKTKTGTFKRPIQKLCRLPNFEYHNDSTRGVCSGAEQSI